MPRREGAGRKSKAEEFKANTIIAGALKKIYNVDTDLEAKEKLIEQLMKNVRGQLFLAEHLLGKPTVVSDVKIQGLEDIAPTLIKWTKTE